MKVDPMTATLAVTFVLGLVGAGFFLFRPRQKEEWRIVGPGSDLIEACPSCLTDYGYVKDKIRGRPQCKCRDRLGIPTLQRKIGAHVAGSPCWRCSCQPQGSPWLSLEEAQTHVLLHRQGQEILAKGARVDTEDSYVATYGLDGFFASRTYTWPIAFEDGSLLAKLKHEAGENDRKGNAFAVDSQKALPDATRTLIAERQAALVARQSDLETILGEAAFLQATGVTSRW